jgi:MFS family permease
VAPLARVRAVWGLLGSARWMFTVAVAVYAYHVSGTGAVGALTAAQLLPAMLAAPLFGGMIDRADRARVVIGSIALSALCLAGTAALALAGSSLGPILLLTGLAGVAWTPTRPALQALMPALAMTPAELTRATGQWAAVDNGGFLVGSGLGGLAIALSSAGAVLAAAAVLVALALVTAARLPAVRATPSDSGQSDESITGVLGGIRAVARTPALYLPFALFAGLLLLEGTTDVQLVALALGPLHLGGGGPGLLYGVWGVGGVLGSWVALRLVRARGFGLVLACGGVTFGGALALSGAGGVAAAVVGMVPAGVGFALVETSFMALIPRLADDALIGRVLGLAEVLYCGAAGVGALMAPALIDAFGTAGSLVAVGLAYGAAALAAERWCRRLDRDQEQASTVRELLRKVPFLAPLPLPRLERLVRGAHARGYDGGAVIVARDEPGHDFFVVESGAIDVVESGERFGPGFGFGEIALLRDVPRTATVRAAGATRVWSITRQAFLAAVSASSDALRIAEAVSAEHLARPRESGHSSVITALRVRP